MTQDKLIAGAGGGGGKGGGGGSRTPKTDKDSLDSRAAGRVLDLISEGEIAGLVDPGFVNPVSGASNSWHQSIFLNNTPLQNADGTYNFEDVEIGVRHGTPNQSAISGFNETASATAVGVTVAHGTPYELTISNTSIDAVRVIINVPVLQKIKSNGDTLGTSVKLRFSKKQGTGSFQDISLDGGTGTNAREHEIKGRTADLYQRQYRFDLTGNTFPVIIRVHRVSIDDTSVDLSGQKLISHTSAFQVSSYSQITEAGNKFNGTYTQANQAGNGIGNVITVNYVAQHNFEAGDGVFLNFTSGTTSNENFEIQSIVNAQQFTVTAADNKQTSGTVEIRPKYSYPNCAVIGVKLDAEQFNAVPQRMYKVRGIKCRIPGAGANSSGTPSVDSTTGRIVYPNGYIFNNVLQAAQWTTDPAFCLLDLLLSSRYGLGEHVSQSQLDLTSFYAASKYCSELVTFKDTLNDGTISEITEPRFSLNVALQKREDAFKVINNLCSVFRGMPYYSAGSLTLTQDKPADSVYLFTNANVTETGFVYEGSSQKTRATVIVVKYLDMTLRAQVFEEVVDHDAVLKYGTIVKNFVAFGCTSRGQARRIGKWMLHSLANETETVSFTTSVDAGVIVRPGNIISIADPVKSGYRRGGKIKATTANNKITVDDVAQTNLPGSDGASIAYTRTLHVIQPDGSICSRTVASITSDGVITVVGDFTNAAGATVRPQLNSIWILETTGGSSTENIQTSRWRVLTVKEKDEFQYEVTALTYNSSKYAHIEEEETLIHRDITNLDELPEAPSRWAQRTEADGSVTTFPIQQLYRYRDQIKVKVIAAWKPVLGVNQYEVHWRQENKSWNIVRQQGPDFEIPDVAVDSSIGNTEFDFKVFSLNGAGKRSTSPLRQNNFQVTGKSAKPSDLTTASFVLDPHLGITLTWEAIVPVAPEFADLDIRGYEIRSGTSWGTDSDKTNRIGEFEGVQAFVGTLASGTTTNYLIKAIDTDGNLSVNAKQVAIAITNPSAPVKVGTGFNYEDDNLILNWTAPTGGSYAVEEYEIYQGSISSANLKGVVSGTTFSLPVTWASDQTFKIRAKDIAGNFGSALDLTVTYTKAPAPNITWRYEGRVLRLEWNAVNGNTKTREYEIRQSPLLDSDGNSFTNVENATLKNTVQATTFALDVNWATSVRFWVRAVDVNGNKGTAGRTGITNYPDISFSLPATPTVTHNSFDGKNENVVLSWDSITKASDGLPISEYKIYRTVSTATSASNLIAKQDGTQYTEKVTWSTGSQKYWVSAVDVNGNEGTADAENVTIQQIPQPANLTQEVVDNNVLLRWEEPSLTGCLPVSFYNLYRTNTQESSLIGSKQGKFTTVFEQAGGTYEYFLAAVDSSGREGIAASKQAKVNEPPDYVLNADLKSALIDGTITATYSQSNDTNTGAGLIVTVTKLEHGLSINQQIEVDFTSGTANGTSDDAKKYVIKSTTTNEFTFEVAGSRQTTGNILYSSPSTLSNAYVIDGVVYFCLDTSTQYQNHFAGTGFDSNGANTVYALPSENSGSYEEVFDYGGVLATSSISVNMSIDSAETIGQGLTITPRIYISADGSSWTDKGAGNGTVLGQDFRYIKTRFDLAGAGNNDLIKVTEISTKLSVKQKTDQGSGTLASGLAQSVYDAGVQVSFTKTFVDIDSISLTLRGSTGDARYAIYDFVDAFAPNGFKVYLYKADGTKTHGTFDWTARGV